MKPAAFEYHRPTDVEAAVALLHDLGDDAKVIAGGQSMVPMLNLRLATFAHLVDIGSIESLRGIERRVDQLWIGAGTTHAEVEKSPLVADTVPLLSRAARHIGHFQIRNRGTIGGSLAHADPAAEFAVVALTLDAQMEATGPSGRRTIPAGEFFHGTWSTALADHELLTGVSFPVWSGRCGFAIEEFARRHGDFALAGATVAVALDSSGLVQRCAIGLLGLGSVPERARAAEATAIGAAAASIDTEALGAAAMSALTSVPSDLHGSGDYRRRVGAAMVARALAAAIEEAGNA